MLQRDHRSLEDILRDLLHHLSPQTDDKPILDFLSLEQIKNVTYRENVLPTEAFSANFLVPQDLYRMTLNQSWLYPPYMKFRFKINKTGENPSLILKIGFGVPRQLIYCENRRRGARIYSGPISQSISVRTPEGFTRLNIDNTIYEMKEGESVARRSVTPIFFTLDENLSLGELLDEKKEFPLSVNSQNIVLKKFDGDTQRQYETSPDADILNCIPDDPENTNPNVATICLRNESINLIAEVEAEESDSPSQYFITVTLLNNCHYHTTNRSSRPIQSQWRPLCLLNPYIVVKMQNAACDLGPQQYEDARKYALENGDPHLGVRAPYSQINGIISKSTSDQSMVVGTTFGIYDLLREDPVYYEKTIDQMIESKNSLLDCLPESISSLLMNNDGFCNNIVTVLKAIRDGFGVKKLYLYQWAAITNRIKILASGEKGTTTIIKAPTGTGKTIVFMGNAVLHFLTTGERVAIVFPTRILNEDMFKRLTKFIYYLRKYGTITTGGIYIGSSDPLYEAVTNPEPGKPMIQYSMCPECETLGSIIAMQADYRVIGQCDHCGHRIDYMFGAREIGDYLPSLIIATPDKLFYDVTAAPFEQFNMRVVGGQYWNCQCGAKVPAMGDRSVVCRRCNASTDISAPKLSSPIGYFVFDEVHTLYGLTGTLLSILLSTLQLIADKINYPNHNEPDFLSKITFETGTATIANEIELLTSITRIDTNHTYVIPGNESFNDYFQLNRNRVRYRTLMLLPVATSARKIVAKGIYSQYHHLHHDPEYRRILNEYLENYQNAQSAYDFVLGYVFKKRDGYNLKRSVNEMGLFEESINVGAYFLSGDSDTREIANIYDRAIRGDIKVLIANMVISLGIDIKNLNNMIALGIPKSMTEHVQTAGRTGRGLVSGHVTLFMLPSYPRDRFVFSNFHAVFSDITGYYDKMPIQSTNAFAAKIIFPNVLKALFASMSYHDYLLTAPSATRYFASNRSRVERLRYDLLRVLTSTSVHPSVRRQIASDVHDEINHYLHRFAEFRGNRQYVSDILSRDQVLLTSLRMGSEKDIPLVATEVELFEELERNHRIPSTTDIIDIEEDDSEETEVVDNA